LQEWDDEKEGRRESLVGELVGCWLTSSGWKAR
jgi:hypothetical protein